MAETVDWDLAAAVGIRLAPAGPAASPAQARGVVRSLARASARAVGPVAEVTGLSAPVPAHPAVVVGRPDWLRANVEQVRIATAPLTALLREHRPSALVREVGARTTAVEMGAVLAWLSGKVLGQYEAFGPSGRLLLVAPNIVHAERQLDVDPADFRLWVCLHEETHRVQFGAVPWLSDHFTGEVHAFLAATDSDGWSTLRRILGSLRQRIGTGPGEGRGSAPGLVDLVQTPEQREILERLTALMSLLEGHADVVMDDVGPRIVPSVARIRERFTRRRTQVGRIDGIVRRVLGLDAKLRQYTEGAAFVRGVVDSVGMPGFNAVWSSPEALPRPDEITRPARWVRRVHG